MVPLVTAGAEDRTLQAEATRLARRWLEDRSGLDEDVLERIGPDGERARETGVLTRCAVGESRCHQDIGPAGGGARPGDR